MTDVPGLTVQRTTPVENLMAQLIGTLDIDSSTNCLVVRNRVGYLNQSGGVAFTDKLIDVAWPPGWIVAIRGEGPALIDATGRTAAHLGDEVALGGGYVDTTRANVTSCTGQDHVFVAWSLTRL